MATKTKKNQKRDLISPEEPKAKEGAAPHPYQHPATLPLLANGMRQSPTQHLGAKKVERQHVVSHLENNENAHTCTCC